MSVFRTERSERTIGMVRDTVIVLLYRAEAIVSCPHDGYESHD